jgi:Mo-dependent nitrogenase C-terminus
VSKHQFNLLQQIRTKLDSIEVKNTKLAIFICQFIPDSCPFEQDIKLFSYLTIHIPPLCKLNPLYQSLVELRFRALCYLEQL